MLGIRWRGLRTKIIAWSFVPTIIILVAVAVVIFFAYQDVTEDLVLERNQELAVLTAGKFSAELDTFADRLSAEARKSDISGKDTVARRDALKSASKRLAIFDGGVLILDTFGAVVAAEPERTELVGQDWSDRTYYRQMLRMEISGLPGPVFSDVVADGPDDAQVVALAVPIAGPRGEFLGLIAGMFRVDPAADNALYGHILKLRLGESGSACLVDGQGTLIYHSDPTLIGGSSSAQELVQQATGGRAAAIRTRNPGGQTTVASFAPVPSTPWSLITEESWDSLSSSSQDYGRFLLVLLALGVALPVLVVALGVRRITRPISELISAAQKVAGGDFGQAISARTGDEIEELADQFSLMASQLQASYTDLQRNLDNRTRELAAVNAIAAVVSQSLDLDEILDAALDKTLEVMEVEAGGIYLVEESSDLLTVAAHRGFTPEFVVRTDRLEVGEGFSGRVAETGQPLVVPDVSADLRLTRMIVRDEQLRALAIVPLSSRGKVLGTLFTVTRDQRQFTDQDIQLLTSIGHQIGIAVENAKLFGQAEQRLQELEALYRADEEMYRHLQLEQVLQALVDVAVDILRADKSAVLLWDRLSERWAIRVARGFGLEAQARLRFAPGEGVTGRVAATGEPAIVEDTRRDPRRREERREIVRAVLEEGIRSVMHLPIKVGGEVFGIFSVCFSEPHAFGRDEVRLFLALAERAARAIENAQLFVAEQRRAEQFRVIGEVGRRITSIQPVDELLEQIARLIREAFGYYLVVIGLVEGDELVFHVGDGALWDDPHFYFEPLQLRVGEEGITGLVASTGQPCLVPDVSQEPRYVWLPGSETRSELAVPIKARGEVIGVLDVESDQVNAFDESDLLVLQSLAHQAAIAIQNSRLYEQAQQLAVVEERSRLARDLHDAVTQTLFSASLIAETMPTVWENDQEEGRDLLQDLRQLSRGALAEMRTLLLELRPAALAEASMDDLVRQLGEAVTGRTGVPVSVTVEGQCVLPADVHVSLYRIVQEALNNVVKHANASEVQVHLRCAGFSSVDANRREQRVRLCVSDNGCGFDPGDIPPNRLGLGIIHERAQGIGAALDVQSKRGMGTEIVAVWTAPSQSGSPASTGEGEP